MVAFDLAQCALWSCGKLRNMKPPDKPRVTKRRKLSRLELARRIIADYAEDLRKIITKLRRRQQ